MLFRSAIPNHQTGRSVSLHTRGVVAMAGTFGYELDPGKLTQEEKAEIKEQIAEYQKYAKLIQSGDYYRLSNPFLEEYAAWMFVSLDQKQVLLYVVMLEIHGNMTVNYVRLKGIIRDGVYQDVQSGRKYSGAALMEVGIPMPVEMGEYLSYRIELRLEEK